MTKKPKQPEIPADASQVDRIIAILGGVRAASRLTNIPPTTISGWRKHGFVPAHRQQAILDAANLAGIKLKPQHFFS